MKSICRNEEKSCQKQADTCRKSFLTAPNGVLLLLRTTFKPTGCEMLFTEGLREWNGAGRQWKHSFNCNTAVNLANYMKHSVSFTQNTEGEGFSRSTVQSPDHNTVSTPSQTRRYPNTASAASGHTLVRLHQTQEEAEYVANVKCGHKLVKSDLPEQWIHICLIRREIQTSHFVAFKTYERSKWRRTVTLRRPRWAFN